jgi:hypothetical protein
VELLNIEYIFNQDWSIRQNELVALTRIQKYQHGVKEQLLFIINSQTYKYNAWIASKQVQVDQLEVIALKIIRNWKVLPCTTPP